MCFHHHCRHVTTSSHWRMSPSRDLLRLNHPKTNFSNVHVWSPHKCGRLGDESKMLMVLVCFHCRHVTTMSLEEEESKQRSTRVNPVSGTTRQLPVILHSHVTREWGHVMCIWVSCCYSQVPIYTSTVRTSHIHQYLNCII